MKSASSIVQTALSLALVAIIGTGLLAWVNDLTKDRIAEQEKRMVLERLGQIVPEGHDPGLLEDRTMLRDEAYFPGGQQVTAWRARRGGEPLAVVLRFDAVNGYNGRIGLLAGINHDGSLRGVRVVSHKETPGLGDAIELRKSNWIRSFDEKRLGHPPPARWAVRRDGGDFDQFSGATITPRAIVDAVRLALTYYEAHRESLFATPAIGEQGEGP
jgi:electron transport complex protein RnfG